jgi:polyhydroxybutyrate depolymerase
MLRAFDPTPRTIGACLCVVLAVVTGACGGKSQDASVTADSAPSPSPGCAGTSSSKTGTVSLRHNGLDRSYEIVVPRKRSGAPTPLVLGYHGYLGGSYELRGRLEARALRDGFVAVFPQGSTVGSTTPAYFNIETVDESLLADDVGFTRALLDQLEADLCIDRTRIYALGFSNGGMFASTLACKLNDRIAAVAPVGGVHLPPDCDGRPVPILITHGTADRIVPFDETDVGRLDGLVVKNPGGLAQDRMFRKVERTPVTSWVESWARHNGCSLDAPAISIIGNTVERTVYADCEGDGDVVLQAVDGGFHDWPTSPTLDATSRALVFFEEHPLPRDALDR